MEKKHTDTHYSLAELKIHWNRYYNLSGLRFLVNGKWVYDFSGERKGLIEATRAETTMLRNHMSFPEYLEKYTDAKNKH